MIRVLFVCMGNICRSPMAEAVFRHLVQNAGLTDQFEIDSAGTLDYHVGAWPHAGTQRVLRAHDIDVGDHRARQVQPYDLDSYDYVLAMDRNNMIDMRYIAPQSKKPRLFLEFAPDQPLREVPDPYSIGNFDEVYHLVYAASQGLLTHIRREHGL